jgi:deoxyribose-phosphate aldolase
MKGLPTMNSTLQVKSTIPEKFSKYIDHTLLKPDTTNENIKRLCQEAVEYNFASVCINPCFVKLAHELTKNSTVKACTVIGFPLGANLTEIKVIETQRAIRDGAEEIDMVINDSVDLVFFSRIKNVPVGTLFSEIFL